jgi:hypothetical protein
MGASYAKLSDAVTKKDLEELKKINLSGDLKYSDEYKSVKDCELLPLKYRQEMLAYKIITNILNCRELTTKERAILLLKGVLLPDFEIFKWIVNRPELLLEAVRYSPLSCVQALEAVIEHSNNAELARKLWDDMSITSKETIIRRRAHHICIATVIGRKHYDMAEFIITVIYNSSLYNSIDKTDLDYLTVSFIMSEIEYKSKHNIEECLDLLGNTFWRTILYTYSKGYPNIKHLLAKHQEKIMMTTEIIKVCNIVPDDIVDYEIKKYI